MPENHMLDYNVRSDPWIISFFLCCDGEEGWWWWWVGAAYPLNVSKDRSLLLGLGGGGRMLSVTGVPVLPGEPSS